MEDTLPEFLELQLQALRLPRLKTGGSRLLEQLIKDENNAVRGIVAQNPKLPLKLLEQLKQDEDNGVRRIVANNPKLRLKLLEQLIRDENNNFRHA